MKVKVVSEKQNNESQVVSKILEEWWEECTEES